MVNLHQIHVGRAVRDHPRHPIEDVHGPAKTHAGAERHEGVHVGRAVDERLEAGCEECSVDDHDDEREDHLRECKAEVIVV